MRRVVAGGLIAALTSAVVVGVTVGAAAAEPVVPGVPGLPGGGLSPVSPVPGVPVPGFDPFGPMFKAGSTAVFDGFGTWVAKGTSSLLAAVVVALDKVTRPDLSAGWFGGQYQAMWRAAFLLAFPLLFTSVITAVVRQDPGGLIRTVTVHLPLAGIGTAVAIQLVNLGLAATDNLCAVVTHDASGDTHLLFDHLRSLLDSTVSGSGGFGLVIVCVVVAAGAFLLVLELVVRASAVYVAVLFLPVVFAGLVWPATARWGRRLAEMLVVLILSKFVVVAIISMAVAALASGLGGADLPGLLTGASLLLMAAAAPFGLLRMVPIVEAGMIGHLEGVGRRPLASSASAASPVRSALGSVRPAPSGQGRRDGAGAGVHTALADRRIGADGTQSDG